jgi:DNA primase
MTIIREEDINEVRDLNDLVEVVSDYVQLKKAGRTYKGLCPFHKEKTPSFFVDPAKQLFHCFGCSEGGNIFSFIMKMEKVEFPEAVKVLAERVNYNLRYIEEDQAKISKREKLYQACEAALQFYQAKLKSKQGQKALEYLKERGFGQEIIDFFKLGYAPNAWDQLTKFLYKKGFTPEELVEAGLSVQGEKGFYDRFRDRIIFPIFNLRGKPVAFGGRIVQEGEPKYLNSPETPIFKKGSLLYALYQAKREIVAQEEVIVVEGYTDVLALFQAGISNTVATLGTAFTAEHFRLISRFTDKILLTFDADLAGKTAAQRGLELLGQAKANLHVITLPPGQDPADLAREGIEKLTVIFAERVPLAQFCIDERLAQFNIEKREEKIRAIQSALKIIAALPSEIAQNEYLHYLAEQAGVEESVVRLEFKRRTRYNKNQEAVEAGVEVFSNPELKAQYKREEELLKLFLQDAELAKKLCKELKEEYFYLEAAREVFNCLWPYWSEGKEPELAKIIPVLGENAGKLASRLMFEPPLTDNREECLRELVVRMKEFFIKKQIDQLHQELRKLNPQQEPGEYDRISQEIWQLENIKRNLILGGFNEQKGHL